MTAAMRTMRMKRRSRSRVAAEMRGDHPGLDL
jgi:hypothetical protein